MRQKQAEQDNPGVIAPPPLIYATGLLISLWLQTFRPLPFLPPTLRRSAGLPLLGSGIFGMIASLRAMRGKKTSFNTRQPTIALVEEFPYTLTRNPIYLSFTLMYCGLTALFNTLWGLLMLPFVLLTMYSGVIAREERYLEKKFGSIYQQYKQRVRRWI